MNMRLPPTNLNPVVRGYSLFHVSLRLVVFLIATMPLHCRAADLQFLHSLMALPHAVPVVSEGGMDASEPRMGKSFSFGHVASVTTGVTTAIGSPDNPEAVWEISVRHQSRWANAYYKIQHNLADYGHLTHMDAVTAPRDAQHRKVDIPIAANLTLNYADSYQRFGDGSVGGFRSAGLDVRLDDDVTVYLAALENKREDIGTLWVVHLRMTLGSSTGPSASKPRRLDRGVPSDLESAPRSVAKNFRLVNVGRRGGGAELSNFDERLALASRTLVRRGEDVVPLGSTSFASARQGLYLDLSERPVNFALLSQQRR